MIESLNVPSEAWPALEDAFRQGFAKAGLQIDAAELTASVRPHIEALCERLREAVSGHKFTCEFDLHLSRAQKRQLITQIDRGLADFREKWALVLFEILAFEIGASEAALYQARHFGSYQRRIE